MLNSYSILRAIIITLIRLGTLFYTLVVVLVVVLVITIALDRDLVLL